MLFPTITFAVFFVIVFVVHWWIRQHRIPWLLFLLGASWFFYGYWDERFVLLLAASTLGNYLLGIALAATRKGIDEDALEKPPPTIAAKFLLTFGVALNLAILGWFKYYGFFATSAINTLADLGINIDPPLLQITLPVGISFFTFQAISYIVDVFRGQIKPLSLLEFAVFLAFFPQLVAGPIVRPTEFAPQLQAKVPAFIPVSEAFRLIFAGLFKKVVISSFLATEIVDPVYAVPEEHSSFEILVATYAYAIQIYADFSGYTDIAIGCALLLGFRFPQNFNSPYVALSVQDFWRRWHMTLSRWLRDYLYISLGGNRGSKIFTMRNLFLTMLLGGLWHGAAWTFVIWGALHGGYLIGERVANESPQVQRYTSRIPPALRPVLRWVLTFHLVCLAWIFFRAESFDVAMTIIWRIFTAWGDAPLVTPLILVTIAASIAAQFVPRDFTLRLQSYYARMAPAVQAAAIGVGLVIIDAMGPEGVAPFIYFQF